MEASTSPPTPEFVSDSFVAVIQGLAASAPHGVHYPPHIGRSPWGAKRSFLSGSGLAADASRAVSVEESFTVLLRIGYEQHASLVIARLQEAPQRRV